MGDMADDMYMQAMMEEGQDEYSAASIIEEYRLGILKWTTKDGKEMLITKMTDEHVQNTYNYLKRTCKDNYLNHTQGAWLKVFEWESTKRE